MAVRSVVTRNVVGSTPTAPVMKKFRDIVNEMESSSLERLQAPRVNYMGPKNGPFKCGHCKFFDSKKSFCQNKMIRTNVQAEGCCNLFEPVR